MTDPFPTPRGALSPDGVTAARPPYHPDGKPDHDGFAKHHHDADTGEPIWWEHAEAAGPRSRATHRHPLGVPGYAGAKGAVPEPGAYHDPVTGAPEQAPEAWDQQAAFFAADRALAFPHREDDQPCGCDECMAYGAEDEGGVDWYRFPTPNRIVIRALDSGDDRLAPLAKAIADHAAAIEAEARAAAPPDIDVERLGAALEAAEVNCWANPVKHEIGDPDEHRQHRLDAIAVAAEYRRLASPDATRREPSGE